MDNGTKSPYDSLTKTGQGTVLCPKAKAWICPRSRQGTFLCPVVDLDINERGVLTSVFES